LLAPASKAALLKNPPGTHLASPVELNDDTVQEKSVPTFSLQSTIFQNRFSAGRRERSRRLGQAAFRQQVLPGKVLNCITVRAGEFLKGRLSARERRTQRPLSRFLLVLFLAKQEKYIIPLV